MILDYHCSLQNQNGVVMLVPFNDDAMCLVNDVEVKGERKLSQGDVVTFGKSIFRFNHPEEAAILREKKRVSHQVQFNFKQVCSFFQFF